jgi:hypothetical protein
MCGSMQMLGLGVVGLNLWGGESMLVVRWGGSMMWWRCGHGQQASNRGWRGAGTENEETLWALPELHQGQETHLVSRVVFSSQRGIMGVIIWRTMRCHVQARRRELQAAAKPFPHMVGKRPRVTRHEPAGDTSAATLPYQPGSLGFLHIRVGARLCLDIC